MAAHDEAALRGAHHARPSRASCSALEAPAPDLAALAAARDAAHAAYTAAVAADTLVRRTLAGLDRVRGSLTLAAPRSREAESRHQVLRELADTVAGTSSNNALRMRLSAFVLAARLEKVATLANERLSGMGEGRYQLRHTDGLAARGARSGLGLEVLDLWTGQTRDTSSLSGGESFMASLALALGSRRRRPRGGRRVRPADPVRRRGVRHPRRREPRAGHGGARRPARGRPGGRAWSATSPSCAPASRTRSWSARPSAARRCRPACDHRRRVRHRPRCSLDRPSLRHAQLSNASGGGQLQTRLRSP